jgi:hypothetical protein
LISPLLLGYCLRCSVERWSTRSMAWRSGWSKPPS